MVIWIGDDCWSIIMRMEFEMEHSKRIKEHNLKFKHCLKEMVYQKTDHIVPSELFCNNRRYNRPKPIFLFLTKKFISDICMEIRGRRNHPIIKLFLTMRHLRIRIILLDDIEGVREISPIIRSVMVGRYIWLENSWKMKNN